MTRMTLALSIGENVIITYSAFFGFDDIQLAAMQLVDAANVQVLQLLISGKAERERFARQQISAILSSLILRTL